MRSSSGLRNRFGILALEPTRDDASTMARAPTGGSREQSATPTIVALPADARGDGFGSSPSM